MFFYFAACVSLAGGFGILRNSCLISACVLAKNSAAVNNLYELFDVRLLSRLTTPCSLSLLLFFASYSVFSGYPIDERCEFSLNTAAGFCSD